jgi:acyl-CoA synthetase (AMP-forming)/AMP-acid ligase II
MVLRPRPDFVLGVASAVLAGGVAAPINHLFKRRELLAYLRLIEPSAILVDAATAESVRGVVDDLERRPLLIGADDNLATDANLLGLAEAAALDACGANPDEPAIILHTSGTTGLPKAVVHTHGEYAAFLRVWSDYLADDDRVLAFAPLYHQAGLLVGWLACFARGVPFYHMERFAAELYWDIVQRNGITLPMALLDPTPVQVIAQPTNAREREHKIRWMMSTMAVDLWRRFQRRFDVSIHSGYGSTETTMITMASSPQKVSLRFDETKLSPHTVRNAAGWAIPGFSEFRVVRKDGEATEPDEIGALQVRGKALFKAYFNDPQNTAAAFTADGWFNPGDAAFIDAQGCLYILGRASEMIRRSGENIAPREVEAVIEELPEVNEVAVVGVADAARGQELRACLVLRAGATLTAEQVFAHCRQELSLFKVPRYLEFRDELPKTSTLKVKRDLLVKAADATKWVDRYKLEGRS